MKNFTKFLAISVFGLAFSVSTFGQAIATASATALATIITPLQITNNRDLSFGNIAVSPTVAGTVTLTAVAATVRTAALGCSLLPANPGTVTSAQFTITGLASSSFAMTFPATATLTGPGADMTVNLTKDLTAPYNTGAGGSVILYVGGTLGVAAAQVDGNYSGTFDVSVNYN